MVEFALFLTLVPLQSKIGHNVAEIGVFHGKFLFALGLIIHEK